MRHLIQKPQFILTIPAGIDPFQAQHEASRFFREQLLPALERIFDELSPEGEVIRLDYCCIDLGAISSAFLRNGRIDEALRQLMAAEIRKMIDKEHALYPVTRSTVRESIMTVWWHYMEHGRLPWNAEEITEEDLQQVIELLSVDYPAITRLRQMLEENARFLTRVVAQHKARFLENLVAVLTSSRQNNLDEAITEATKVHLFIEELRNARLSSPRRSRKTKARSTVFSPLDIAEAFNEWATLMSEFIRAPRIERKAFLWRRLLIEAAVRPTEFARTGGIAILLNDIPAVLPLAETILTSGELSESNSSFIIALRSHLKLAAAHHKAAEPPAATPQAERQPESPLPITPAAHSGTPAAGDRQRDRPSKENSTDTPKSEQQLQSKATADGETRPTSREKIVNGENVVFQSAEVTEDGIYLTNAGVILLHPFLSTLFHRLGLWNGTAFTSIAARQKAVFLLHYLATGSQRPPEHALVFAKMLCGYSLEMPIPGEIELTEDECVEALTLIESAIQRWEKLGASTVDGLREAFLQRRGKLANKNGRLSLQMESMGIDILLDYLPWNLHLVKLPWLKDILYVDWR
jgi:hypothetical protein